MRKIFTTIVVQRKHKTPWAWIWLSTYKLKGLDVT